MSPQELHAWIVLTGTLLTVGTQTIDTIKSIFSAAALTPEQQAVILDAVMDDAKRRRTMSAAIAGLSVDG